MRYNVQLFIIMLFVVAVLSVPAASSYTYAQLRNVADTPTMTETETFTPTPLATHTPTPLATNTPNVVNTNTPTPRMDGQGV